MSQSKYPRYLWVQIGLVAGGIGLGAFYFPYFFRKYLKGDIDVPDERTELPMTVPKIVKRELELQRKGADENKRLHHFYEIGSTHEDKVAGWETKPEVHRLNHRHESEQTRNE